MSPLHPVPVALCFKQGAHCCLFSSPALQHSASGSRNLVPPNQLFYSRRAPRTSLQPEATFPSHIIALFGTKRHHFIFLPNPPVYSSLHAKTDKVLVKAMRSGAVPRTIKPTTERTTSMRSRFMILGRRISRDFV